MNPAVSLYLDLSVGILYLHLFTINPCYLDNSNVNISITSGLTGRCHHNSSGHKLCALQLIGGVAQWLGCRSLADRLSLIYSWSMADM